MRHTAQLGSEGFALRCNQRLLRRKKVRLRGSVRLQMSYQFQKYWKTSAVSSPFCLLRTAIHLHSCYRSGVCVSHSLCARLPHSPSPHVILNALISSLKHPVVLFLTKKDVRLEQVLIERVHARSQAALLAHPLACLNINHVPWRITDKMLL